MDRVEAIYVAVRRTEMERVQAQVAEYGLGSKVAVVEGGDVRQQSVTNALEKLVADTGCGQDDVLGHVGGDPVSHRGGKLPGRKAWPEQERDALPGDRISAGPDQRRSLLPT